MLNKIAWTRVSPTKQSLLRQNWNIDSNMFTRFLRVLTGIFQGKREIPRQYSQSSDCSFCFSWLFTLFFWKGQALWDIWEWGTPTKHTPVALLKDINSTDWVVICRLFDNSPQGYLKKLNTMQSTIYSHIFKTYHQHFRVSSHTNAAEIILLCLDWMRVNQQAKI